MQSSTSVIAQAATIGFVMEPMRQIVPRRHRRFRASAGERESASCLDVHLAVAGQDRHDTRNDTGLDMTIEQPLAPESAASPRSHS